jgi:glucan 1,4-alpha-glucosidase
MTKKLLLLCNLILISVFQVIAQNENTLTATSGNVQLHFSLTASGVPNYSVSYKYKTIILPSAMGFVCNEFPFKDGFEVVSSEKKKVNQSWKPVWGQEKSICDKHEQLIVHLRQTASPNRLLDIVFRVFDDGVGFRYEFPLQPNLKFFVVAKELTEFNLTGNHKTFWIPGDYDTNEYPYTVSKLSEVDAWKLARTSLDIAIRTAPDQFAVQTPLMMKTDDGLYINIHEAALVNYPAMQLHVDRDAHKLSASLVPDVMGNKAYLRSPEHTPWRTIIVSDKATDILASRMILNLNEPSKIVDSSWIKPMKFMGVWWEMITGNSNWSYSNNLDSLDASGSLIPHNKHAANTKNVKRYIDFASKQGIKGLLVEGWNVGWEEWFGYWKENVFDFVTPYPDFDIKELAEYAKEKNVHLIMHHETSGAATNYEQQMDTAYRLMNQYGYTSVKTGYVGKIIPRGEYHDGQWMINHYIRVAQKTADYHIMVDMHEPVRPTGLQRTYPNWLACEAARGNEYNAFSPEGNPPEHETILPFTRLMGGPMDYTPGLFKIKNFNSPENQVHTTLAKQLALYVVFYSPLQMIADKPENYEGRMDAFQFLKDVPVEWDNSTFIEAEPGEYITIARKEKDAENWYIGSITGTKKHEAEISLDFLDKSKKYTATIYADAENADWKLNPEAYKITRQTVTAKSVLKLKLVNGGGAAVSIKPL